jgi:hypothetical protein
VYWLNESRLLMADDEWAAGDGQGCKQNGRPHSAISDEWGGYFTRPGLIECVRPRIVISQHRSNVCTLDSRPAAAFRWSAAVARRRSGDENKLNVRPAECHMNSTGLASGDSMKCSNDQNHSFFRHSARLTTHERTGKPHVERAIRLRFGSDLSGMIRPSRDDE